MAALASFWVIFAVRLGHFGIIFAIFGVSCFGVGSFLTILGHLSIILAIFGVICVVGSFSTIWAILAIFGVSCCVGPFLRWVGSFWRFCFLHYLAFSGFLMGYFWRFTLLDHSGSLELFWHYFGLFYFLTICVKQLICRLNKILKPSWKNWFFTLASLKASFITWPDSNVAK